MNLLKLEMHFISQYELVAIAIGLGFIQEYEKVLNLVWAFKRSGVSINYRDRQQNWAESLNNIGMFPILILKPVSHINWNIAKNKCKHLLTIINNSAFVDLPYNLGKPNP